MSEWAKEDLAHSVRNVVHLLRSEANLVGFFGQNRAQVKCGAVADYLSGALAEYEKRVSPPPPEVK